MYADQSGKIYDPVGGAHDLKKGILKLNKNCPIQILQTLSTAAKTGFKIPKDGEIDLAIKKNAASLDPELIQAWWPRLYDGSAGVKGQPMLHELIKQYEISVREEAHLSSQSCRPS